MGIRYTDIYIYIYIYLYNYIIITDSYNLNRRARRSRRARGRRVAGRRREQTRCIPIGIPEFPKNMCPPPAHGCGGKLVVWNYHDGLVYWGNSGLLGPGIPLVWKQLHHDTIKFLTLQLIVNICNGATACRYRHATKSGIRSTVALTRLRDHCAR